MGLGLMEEYTPLCASQTACKVLSPKPVEFVLDGPLRIWPERRWDDCGSSGEDQQLPHETHLWRATVSRGLCRPLASHLAAVNFELEQLLLETELLRLRRERVQPCLSLVKSTPEQPHHEPFDETLRRAIRAIERKQAELPHETPCSGRRARHDFGKGWVQRYDAANNDNPKQDERPHETQWPRRFLWGVDELDWQVQEVQSHEPMIQRIRVVVAVLDPIDHSHKTPSKSVLPNGHGWKYVAANDTMTTGGTRKKTAVGSYLCFPVNQQSSYSQSPPISVNQRAEDTWRGKREEDKDPNGGTTVVTIRDEDQKSDQGYTSSFTSAQFSTLAVSSLLLCLMVLFPNFAQKNQAITAPTLMGATLGSLVSLETILKCPNLARSCGYFAITSLLVAIGSLLSTSVDWVTI